MYISLNSMPRYQSGLLSSFTYFACHESMASLHLAALRMPSRAIFQALLPSVPKKFCVVAIPFAAGAELHDRHVPGDDHGDYALLAGLQGEADGDGAVDLLVAADPGFVAVGEVAVFGERLARVILPCRRLCCRSSNVV